MMNGVAEGGIYPEIYSVLGESISVARIDARLFTLAITSNYLAENELEKKSLVEVSCLET